ncbi:MAG: precorrin-8X methylmutase [Alphaproteobacteria bacterium]|nr:precorrin-8X methylmutase [Alphaproteobacteria bacterium]
MLEAPKRLGRTEEGWLLGRPAPSADWLRDPQAIYAQSFATIRREVDLDALPDDLRGLVTRVVHACGMTDIVEDLRFSPQAGAAGRAALAAGAPILADCEMVAHGIIRRRLNGNPVICTLNDPAVAEMAKRMGTTRSAAALELWRPHLDGAVVAIGNAPTALFHLLAMEGARPALVLGFPVGFVGAAESKDALAASDLPHVTLLGRRGGSAMAAAAVNALSGEEEA